MVPFHFFSLFLRPQTHATWTNLTRITWQKLACGRGPGVGEGSGHPSCFLLFHHQNHQILSLGLKPARECWPAGWLDRASCSTRFPGAPGGSMEPLGVVPGSLSLMVITLRPCFWNRLSGHHLCG